MLRVWSSACLFSPGQEILLLKQCEKINIFHKQMPTLLQRASNTDQRKCRQRYTAKDSARAYSISCLKANVGILEITILLSTDAMVKIGKWGKSSQLLFLTHSDVLMQLTYSMLPFSFLNCFVTLLFLYASLVHCVSTTYLVRRRQGRVMNLH